MERILIKAVNWLGDLVISLPAMRAVRRSNPQAHIAVLVRRDLASFFAGATWIDEVIPYERRRGVVGINDHLEIIRQLRRRRFTLAILFPRSFEAALWPALAAIPRRAGVSADGRGWLLTARAAIDTHNPNRHQAQAYLDMLRETLGIIGDIDDVLLEASPPAQTSMRAWLTTRRRAPDTPLIALAPGAAYGPAKQWPAESYSALIDALSVGHGAECVLLGAPTERGLCTEIAAASQYGAVVAAGETSIEQAIALLSLCQGFVGNDSGSMHIAGALGIPTVGIFGSTNPVRTGPLGPHTRVLYRGIDCSPCLQRTCQFGHYNCLREITPSEAAAALTDLRALT